MPLTYYLLFGSGSIKLDALFVWSIANVFCKVKMKTISCLVERVTSEFSLLPFSGTEVT